MWRMRNTTVYSKRSANPFKQLALDSQRNPQVNYGIKPVRRPGLTHTPDLKKALDNVKTLRQIPSLAGIKLYGEAK